MSSRSNVARSPASAVAGAPRSAAVSGATGAVSGAARGVLGGARVAAPLSKQSGLVSLHSADDSATRGSTAIVTTAATLFRDGLHLVFEYLTLHEWATSADRTCTGWHQACRTQRTRNFIWPIELGRYGATARVANFLSSSLRLHCTGLACIVRARSLHHGTSSEWEKIEAQCQTLFDHLCTEVGSWLIELELAAYTEGAFHNPDRSAGVPLRLDALSHLKHLHTFRTTGFGLRRLQLGCVKQIASLRSISHDDGHWGVVYESHPVDHSTHQLEELLTAPHAMGNLTEIDLSTTQRLAGSIRLLASECPLLRRLDLRQPLPVVLPFLVNFEYLESLSIHGLVFHESTIDAEEYRHLLRESLELVEAPLPPPRVPFFHVDLIACCTPTLDDFRSLIAFLPAAPDSLNLERFDPPSHLPRGAFELLMRFAPHLAHLRLEQLRFDSTTQASDSDGSRSSSAASRKNTVAVPSTVDTAEVLDEEFASLVAGGAESLTSLVLIDCWSVAFRHLRRLAGCTRLKHLTINFLQRRSHAQVPARLTAVERRALQPVSDAVSAPTAAVDPDRDSSKRDGGLVPSLLSFEYEEQRPAAPSALL